MVHAAALLLMLSAAPAPDIPVPSARPPSAPVEADAVSPEVQGAIEVIDSTKQLRIIGPFGRFHGYAVTVDADGLHGLRPAPGLGMVTGLRDLRWDEIDQVDVRDGNVRKGATHGALLLGALGVGLGAMIGGAIGSMDGGTKSDPVTFSLAGAGAGLLVGGSIGAITGAGVGAAIPAWRTVYVRP